MTTMINSFAVGQWLELLADASIKGLVVLLLAWAIVLGLRRGSAALRHHVWLFAAVGLLLMPLSASVLPGWRVELPPAAQASSVSAGIGQTPGLELPPASAGSSQGSVRDKKAVGAGRPVEAGVMVSTRRAGAGWGWQTWLAVAWATGVVVALTPLFAGLLFVRRLRRGAIPVKAGDWLELVDELRTRLGVSREVELRISPTGNMPMTWGFWRPVMVLPGEAEEWPKDQRRVVVAHELAHIQRRDWLAQIATHMVCSVYWFNPLAWYAASRMRVERETACDDQVLQTGLPASVYGQKLLALASRLTASRLAVVAGAPMARRSNLEGRLISIMDAERDHSGARRGAVFLFSVIMAVAVGLISAARVGRAQVPADNPPPPPPAAGLDGEESGHEKPDRVRLGDTRYFVRLVVGGPDQMTFEGQETSWEEVSDLIKNMPGRSDTVLEFAVASEDVTLRQLNQWRAKAAALSRQFGFEYFSYVGVHDLGAKGSSASPRPRPQRREANSGSVQPEAPARGLPVAKEMRAVIHDIDGGEVDVGLDLDTGRVFDLPPLFEQWSAQERSERVREAGIDLFADYDKTWRLGSSDLKLATVSKNFWTRATPELVHVLFETDERLLTNHIREGLTIYTLPNDEVPRTLAFQTGEGACGLLQIVRFGNRPRSMELRFKIVKLAPSVAEHVTLDVQDGKVRIHPSE